MFYAFCHNWSIVLCETKSKLFPARIPNYQAVLEKFGFVEMCITPHNAEGGRIPPLPTFYLNILLSISINLAYAQYGDNRI